MINAAHKFSEISRASKMFSTIYFIIGVRIADCVFNKLSLRKREILKDLFLISLFFSNFFRGFVDTWS